MSLRIHRRIAAALLAFAAGIAQAESARDFLGRFEQDARARTAGFSASPARGADFFKTPHGNDWSCSTCHGDNPAAAGRHTRTGKTIEPLAPAANARRFSEAGKVDKWFKRNCNDVVGRACTPAEKADLLAYLIAIAR